MNLFSLKLFFLPRRKRQFVDQAAFLSEFRPLARRYTNCFSELYRVGMENLRNLGVEVIDEVESIHNRLEILELEMDGVDMDKIRARVDKRCTVKDLFWGQWNRVVEYVFIYEEIFGEDPETAEWMVAHAKDVA
jgi:hypothetical protein